MPMNRLLALAFGLLFLLSATAATRMDAAYILESLVEPSKALAQGFESLGLSPMPPMGDIFSAQELADIQAFVLTLK